MKKSAFLIYFSIILCIGAWFHSPILMGQSAGTGALTVNIADPNGAVIASASVKISNSAEVNRIQTTGANGSLTFTLLPPGTYRVSISALGFETDTIAAVPVNVTETEVLNQRLRIGSQTEQVTVTTTEEALQTETSALGGVVGRTSLVSIPLAARNFTQIVNLSPGVITGVTDASAFGRGSQSIYVDGHDDGSNSYLLDGAQISNWMSSTIEDSAGAFYGSIPIPSPDSLQEFKVVTSTYDASLGRTPGAEVSLISKTGSNDWHGNVFEFFKNDILNANTYFSKLVGVPRGALKQNQYGGTFGGPIQKDKLFFFLSYQGTHQINGVASQGSSSVTLPAALTNDRSQTTLGAEFCHQATYPAVTGAANPASDQVACDGSNLNSISLALLNAKLPNGTYKIPSPQVILPSGTGFSYYSVPALHHEEQVLFNLDYALSTKHTLSGRYLFVTTPNVTQFTSSTEPPGSPRGDVNGDELFTGKVTSLLGHNAVNEVRFTSYHIKSDRYQLSPDLTSTFGVTPALGTYPVMPVISITATSLSFGGGQTDNVTTPLQAFEWSDQISWIHGRHNLRAGYSGQRNIMNICNCGKTRGTLTFQTFSDFLLGMSGAENGTSLSNIYTSATTAKPFTEPNLAREDNMGVFVQDDYRISSRLTLNSGLRWEYLGTGYDTASYGGTNAEWSLFQKVPIPPSTGTYAGFAVSPNFTGAIPAGVIRRRRNLLTSGLAPLNNFGPRIGFAWQPFKPNDRLVVRGGGGIFYKLIDAQHFLNTWDGAPPIAVPFSQSGSSNAAADFAIPFTPAIQIGTFSYFLRTPTSALNVLGVDPNLVTPITYNWSLGTQYAIMPDLVLELAYVGQRTNKNEAALVRDVPTLATASTPVNCGGPYGCITTNTSANAPRRVPVLGLGAGGFSETANVGFSDYHSLQGTLRKAISHGLQFEASYTLGRCLTNMLGTSTAASGQGGSIDYNIGNAPGYEKGECGYDRPQRLIVNFLYSLPRFQSGRGVFGEVLSHWGVAGVITAQSGNPITLTDSRGGQVYGAVGTSAANLCPGQTIGDVLTKGSTHSRLDSYFNKSAFCATPVIGKINGVGGATGYGNIGVNPVLGPSQNNWDLSLTRNIPVGIIRKDSSLQFRADMFNAFNHAQFSNPASNVGSSGTFGVITSTTVGPRIIQAVLKYDF